MAKRSDTRIPEEVMSEVLLPARGETVYWLVLADEDVELLSQGFCSERIAREAFAMLRWKRQIYRAVAERQNQEIA